MTEATIQAGENESLMTEAPRVAAPARRFDFAHKVFSVAGALFQIDPQTDDPVYSVDLGDVRANPTFVAPRAAFGLEPEDPDSKLLDDVGRALSFVKRIRPGDTMPSELLDGTASWTVSDQHRAIARGRITVGLTAWMSGNRSSQQMGMLTGQCRRGRRPDRQRAAHAAAPDRVHPRDARPPACPADEMGRHPFRLARRAGRALGHGPAARARYLPFRGTLFPGRIGMDPVSRGAGAGTWRA